MILVIMAIVLTGEDENLLRELAPMQSQKRPAEGALVSVMWLG